MVLDISQSGLGLLQKLSEITKKTNEFNKKYLSKVIEGKRGSGVFKSFFDKFKANKNITPA